MPGERKQRAAADQERPDRRGDHAGRDHRNEAARLPFEQQKLDREQHRGDRRAEDRGHAGGGAGDEQRLALRRAQLKHCANSEPMAPPVMMIGPSAPNGPPVPIEIADDSGLRIATFGCIRLPPIRIASIASGMP